jgi:hypothetical protein
LKAEEYIVKQVISIVTLVFVILTGVTKTHSQGITLYSARPVNVGARAAGFADAYVADAHDASIMYWNPAALAYLENTSVLLDHQQEQQIHGMNENLSVPFQLRRGEAVALGFTVNHVGYIGNLATDFKAIQYGYDIAYAREIIPTLSVGGGIVVRYAKSSGSNVWGVSSTAGVFYSPSQEISYGIALSGIGSEVFYAFDRTTSITSVGTENMPRRLQAGASLRFPPEFSQTVFILSIANEKIFGESGIRYEGGMELLVWKILALRGGYVVDPGFGSARFGFGIHTAKFEVDCSSSPSKFTDQSFHLGVMVSLWSQKSVQR